MPKLTKLGELNRDEVAELAQRDAIVILTTGSIEQHGPHLPLLTDSLLVNAVLHAGLEELAVRAPVVMAPLLPYGNSHHHLFSCGVSLTTETYLRVLHDIGDSLVTSGFRRLFVLNGHGGNEECISLFAKDLSLRHDVTVATCSYWNLMPFHDGHPREVPVPGHAGAFETSLLLEAAPHLVRTERAPSTSVCPPPVFDGELVPGVRVQQTGEWERVDGYTDPSSGIRAGRDLIAAAGKALAAAIEAFDKVKE